MQAPKKPRTPRGQRPHHDDLTQHYPRTLEEAFGPGEGGPVAPMDDSDPPADLSDLTWFDRVVLVVIPLVLIVVLVGLIFVGLEP